MHGVILPQVQNFMHFLYQVSNFFMLFLFCSFKKLEHLSKEMPTCM